MSWQSKLSELARQALEAGEEPHDLRDWLELAISEHEESPDDDLGDDYEDE